MNPCASKLDYVVAQRGDLHWQVNTAFRAPKAFSCNFRLV